MVINQKKLNMKPKNSNATEVPQFVNEATTTLQEFGNNPLYTFSLAQVVSVIQYSIYQMQVGAAISTSNGPPVYYTRKDAAKILHISLPTLNKYTKLAVIPGVRIGTRVLYKAEVIEEACKGILPINYQRDHE